jgi:NAD(P)-dependent dehydrogenase (short-subunit alcohol dehydrogenase family)
VDLKLRGRKALIAGGSRGIGLAIAVQLAEEGVDLVLVARDAAGLAEARRTILAHHAVQVDLAPCDLGSRTAIDALVAAHPDIDILINNANAVRTPGRLEEVEDEAWWAAWQVKAVAAMRLTRAYLPRLSACGHGVVVTVIGVNGERPSPNFIVQSTACAALVSLTRALGKDTARTGVRVLGVNPRYVNTPAFVERVRAEAARTLGDAERWRELQADLPFGRGSDPEEVAALVAFLASDRAGYISGAVINIDGGVEMVR